MSNLSNPDKVYRVAQWAAGRIGQSAMRAIVAHPKMELVGLHVHSESKEGRDAGELSGVESIGVKATRDIESIIALKPDCVLYMQEGYNIDDIARLLESGINIVTTRNEFFYSKTMNPELKQRVEAACEKGASSIFATGTSPGFSTAVLPMALTYISTRVDCITIDEFADIPLSTTPEMITNVMGFGHPAPEEFNQQRLDHMSEGFAQSLMAVADGLNINIEGIEASGEFAVATKPKELPSGDIIEKGSVAAQRITIAAMRSGKPVLRFRANWYCTKDIDQQWELADNGWRVLVEGDTPLDVSIGFPASSESIADQMSGLTSHPAVNAIPYVCEAAPGVRTNVDLPHILPNLG